jgi:serine/threonine protein kinase
MCLLLTLVVFSLSLSLSCVIVVLTIPTMQFAEVLGSGAFKIVYKGVDQQRGAEVAWNKLRPSVSEADFQRLYEEVRLLQSLNHERIIHFVHSWLDMDNKQLVFITEYMTSGTLRRFVDYALSLSLSLCASIHMYMLVHVFGSCCTITHSLCIV